MSYSTMTPTTPFDYLDNTTFEVIPNKCSLTLSAIGILLTLTAFSLFLYVYLRHITHSPINSWYVHFILLLGTLMLFVLIISMETADYVWDIYLYLGVFLQLPFSTCFSSLFTLSLNMIIYNLKINNKVLVFVTLFLIIIPFITVRLYQTFPNSQYIHILQHELSYNLFNIYYLYCYLLLIVSVCMCLSADIKDIHGKLLFSTVTATWILWTIHCFTLGLMFSTYIIILTSYIILFVYIIPHCVIVYKAFNNSFLPPPRLNYNKIEIKTRYHLL
uniref:G-protein coupled receptor 12 n=1 Tax=Elephant endotheliotropic herpesvirus 1A TaxID=759753 RepID=A0A8B6NQ36_ELHV1|nr:G-protein coupled receptor 12 [Elephant endotheliotropic herpesvirus 1A]